MKLTEKQMVSLEKILGVVKLDNAETLVVEMVNDPNLANLKAARKELLRQVKAIDKALLVYGIDLAIDEAQKLIEKR
jgi:hypothetical protein